MLRPVLGAACLCATTASLAFAQAEPSAQRAFKVVNVDASDVLNIRNGPSSDHDVVAELQPNSRSITITGSCRQQWCPIQHEIGSGWVNRRFLAGDNVRLASIPPPAASDVPEPMRPAAPAKSGNENLHPAETAFRYFLAQGWTTHQSAGIVGNLQVECGVAFTCSNASGGIAQWRGDRVARFRQVFGYAFSQATLEDQLAYIHWELTHPSSPWKASGVVLRSAQDEVSAASLFDDHYERSAGTTRGKRIANARVILRKYVGGPGS